MESIFLYIKNNFSLKTVEKPYIFPIFPHYQINKFVEITLY